MLCLASVLPMLLMIPEKFENLDLRTQSRDFLFWFCNFGNDNLEKWDFRMCRTAEANSIVAFQVIRSMQAMIPHQYLLNPLDFRTKASVILNGQMSQSSSHLWCSSDSQATVNAFLKTLLSPVWSIESDVARLFMNLQTISEILVPWLSSSFDRIPAPFRQ